MLLQLAVNAAILSPMYAVLGISWGVIFNVTGTFHFSQALTYLLSGYVGAYVFDRVGLPFALAFTVAIAVAIAFGVVTEMGLYRPLRRASANPFVILVASLGLLIIGQNVILLVFGTIPIAMTRFHVVPYSIGTVNFANTYVISVVVCAIVAALYVYFINRTLRGTAMRAATSNLQMAQVIGVNIPNVYLLSFIIGSALAGVTGYLRALTHAASLDMGIEMVLIAFMATLMGGVGHLWGAIIAGVIMGCVQVVGILFIGSEWQIAILYLLLSIIIVVRPRGIFGAKITQAEI